MDKWILYMEPVFDTLILEVNKRLDETDFKALYTKVSEKYLWTPTELIDIILLTIYRLEHLKLMEYMQPLNAFIHHLRDEDEVKKITRVELLYMISFLDKVNNHRKRTELNLYS